MARPVDDDGDPACCSAQARAVVDCRWEAGCGSSDRRDGRKDRVQESLDGLDVQVDPGCLVVHRDDDPRTDRVEEAGDLGVVDRRRSARRRQDDVRAGREPARARSRRARGRRGKPHAGPRIGVDDRDLVVRRPLGGLEDADRLDRDAPELGPPGGRSRARIVSNGGTIWPRWL